MAIIETKHKVKLSPSKIGTSGARLSDTKSGKASSIQRHPAGKAIKEQTVLEGLRKIPLSQLLQENEESMAELDAWIAEYDAVRAELEIKQAQREAVAESRRKEHLSLVADWES